MSHRAVARRNHWTLIVLALTLLAIPSAQSQTTDRSVLQKPVSRFVAVNGARLEYLDWGGDGASLVFLAGLGGTAYVFNDLAGCCKRYSAKALNQRALLPEPSISGTCFSSRALLDTDYEVLRHRRADIFPSCQRFVRDKDHRSGADSRCHSVQCDFQRAFAEQDDFFVLLAFGRMRRLAWREFAEMRPDALAPGGRSVEHGSGFRGATGAGALRQVAE
jgi:hypothetical protein